MAPSRRLLFFGIALATTGLIGWGLAAVFPPETSALGSRAVVNREIETLLNRQEQGLLTPDERFQLVERLIAINRFDQALDILVLWHEENPSTIELTLLIADLRRRSGDHVGATNDLSQLLRLHPDALDAVKLKALIQQESGHGHDAIQRIEAQLKESEGNQQLNLGLLLADLQRVNGDQNSARVIYQQLSEDFPDDARAVLALALLEREDGNFYTIQTLLAEAKSRRSDHQSDPLIDQLAGSWGLEAARVRAVQPAAADRP